MDANDLTEAPDSVGPSGACLLSHNSTARRPC